MNAVTANDTNDTARELQRALYRAAKAGPSRRNRRADHGNADSGPMNDFGKPGAGESHARFAEGRLETGHGLGTAAPAMKCVDSAGPIGHRASLLLCSETRIRACARECVCRTVRHRVFTSSVRFLR